MTMVVLTTIIIVFIGLYAIQAFIFTKLPSKVGNIIEHQRRMNMMMMMMNVIDDSHLHNDGDVQNDLDTEIYCNVELNTDYIEAVGFDMDFTLAQVSIFKSSSKHEYH